MQAKTTTARQKLPNYTIRAPAKSGPRKAMNRGALSANAVPIARDRVG
jgi:hypothetical protein